MAFLHNRVSHEELRRRLMAETEPRKTISFYRYTSIGDPSAFRDQLYQDLSQLNVFGRIYVAREGVNAQVSIPESRLEAFRKYLDEQPGFQNLRLNVAVDDDGKSFFVLKIKVRDKIVADGIDDPSFNPGHRGEYLNAEQFNRLTDDPDTIVVDMRNHYEYEVGHFRGALEIPSDTFREQLPMAADLLADKKDRNIIMYCTGGIRCEKASAYLLHQGFSRVYHLEGGIIHYANTVRERGLENKFLGKNFVFDERLGERIGDEIISQCHQCGAPCDTHTNCQNDGCHLLFIQCDVCREKFENCCCEECRTVKHWPADERGAWRKGRNERNIFNKSRLRPRLDTTSFSKEERFTLQGIPENPEHHDQVKSDQQEKEA